MGLTCFEPLRPLWLRWMPPLASPEPPLDHVESRVPRMALISRVPTAEALAIIDSPQPTGPGPVAQARLERLRILAPLPNRRYQRKRRCLAPAAPISTIRAPSLPLVSPIDRIAIFSTKRSGLEATNHLSRFGRLPIERQHPSLSKLVGMTSTSENKEPAVFLPTAFASCQLGFSSTRARTAAAWR